jgi:dihydroorotate dehydrogenase electron transfer subunit
MTAAQHSTASLQRSHRGTIFVETAVILSHVHVAGDQHILRLTAPETASHADPGSFVHLQCDERVAMRRPLSIMRADAAAGWIELLYKVVGPGLLALTRRHAGETLSVIGPIGKGFVVHPERRRALAIGGGVGIPPMIFLAERIRADRRAPWSPMVLMGSEIPFPFTTRPSKILCPAMPEGTIACMPLLDDWGVPSRLASRSGFAGCYEGFVTELARDWLQSLPETQLNEIEVFACGPTPMLAATAALARSFELPCQVSLEEYMACAVGGCAGCAVPVQTPEGPAMKRVCVDGPVFDAYSVFG